MVPGSQNRKKIHYEQNNDVDSKLSADASPSSSACPKKNWIYNGFPLELTSVSLMNWRFFPQLIYCGLLSHSFPRLQLADWIIWLSTSCIKIMNNYSSSPNGLWVNSPWGRSLSKDDWNRSCKRSQIYGNNCQQFKFTLGIPTIKYRHSIITWILC